MSLVVIAVRMYYFKSFPVGKPLDRGEALAETNYTGKRFRAESDETVEFTLDLARAYIVYSRYFLEGDVAGFSVDLLSDLAGDNIDACNFGVLILQVRLQKAKRLEFVPGAAHCSSQFHRIGKQLCKIEHFIGEVGHRDFNKRIKTMGEHFNPYERKREVDV